VQVVKEYQMDWREKFVSIWTGFNNLEIRSNDVTHGDEHLEYVITCNYIYVLPMSDKQIEAFECCRHVLTSLHLFSRRAAGHTPLSALQGIPSHTLYR
jgi:hypothetical protein